MSIPPLPAAVINASRQHAVLLVDDEAGHLGLLRTTMLEQGYQTFLATSGERAIDIAQRVKPDLILLDVVLQGIDGIETCRRLKADPATARIPIIFMSARTETDDVVAGFDAGAADYINKPLKLGEVCARVRSQLLMRSDVDSQQQQTERLRLIVNGMDEGLMVIEASGRIQYSNPACERHLGYEAGELAGATVGQLLSPGVTQEYLAYFAAWSADPETVHPRGEPLSLVVIDVDQFPLHNDKLGHAAGDACLRKVAAALQSHALRPTDIAARYGGEEFVLLFAETGAETALKLAESIRAHIESLELPNPRSSTSTWLTISVGLATIIPSQRDEVEAFFVAADRAMYDAKEAGRNRVVAADMRASAL